jgi:cell wall-associated NlpC family hydrolase
MKFLISVVSVVMLAACGSSIPEEEGTSTSALASGSVAGRVSGTGADGLRVRTSASTSGAQIGSLSDGDQVTISCQVKGENIQGNDVWDYVPAAGGYVSDAFVVTGYDGFVPGSSRCPIKVETGGGGATTPDTAGSGSGTASMAAAAIAEARSHTGYVEGAGKCNKFSAYYGRSGGCQEWCSDFVNYAWMKAGFRVDGITGYSGTVYDYGKKMGTVKSPSSTNVKPGDAVLWGAIGGFSAHVGMVTAANTDGSIKVIHGNFGVGPGGAGMVYESTIARSNQVGSGYNIYAFVAPVPK